MQEELRPTHHRRRIAIGITSIAVLIALTAVGAAAYYAWFLNAQITRVPIKGLASEQTSGAEQHTENILLIGSTDRCALTVQNPEYGLCSYEKGINSDVVMILHLNPTTHAVSILSIPRDLFIPNARTTGANKIDAALYDGPNQLIAAIQHDFAIPIQHFVELNFDTFANVVDALGGIKMYFPEPVFDSYSGLNVQTVGCHELSGFRALQVVRARHLRYKPPSITTDDVAYWPYDPQSDLARIRRDHEFLAALATAVAKRGLGNPLTDERIVSAVAPQLEVDSHLTAGEMVSLARTFHGVDMGKAPQLTMPVQIDHNGNYIYEGGDYGDIEFPSITQDQRTIDKFLGVSASVDTMTGKTLPAPSDVTVSVLGGTGVEGQATQTAQLLRANGFKITSVGNTSSVATQSETTVYYGSNSPTAIADAEVVTHSLSGAVIMALDPAMVSPSAMVTVVTGSDFTVKRLPNTGTSGSSGSRTSEFGTGSSIVGASSNRGIGAPTDANPQLEPWDPRSCPDSATS